MFLYHSFYTEYSYISESAIYRFVKSDLLRNASIGVNFFFVLSGFLITFLLLEEKKATQNIRISHFYKKRILRIWPLYFFCVLFGFLIFPVLKKMAGQVPDETANPLYYLSLFANFDVLKNGHPDSSVLGVLWSIAIEEQFYLVWPLFIFLIPRKQLPALFALILVGTFIFRALNDVERIQELHTMSCIGDLTVGAFGAYFIQYANGSEKIARLSRFAILGLYCAFFLIYFFRKPIRDLGLYVRIFERSFLAVIILLIILEQCYSKKSFFKMSSFRRISKLGTITYGLYCLHFIGILAATNLSKKVHLNESLWQVLILETAVALGISIFLSKLSFRYFESPFLRIKNRLSAARSPAGGKDEIHWPPPGKVTGETMLAESKTPA